MELEKLMGMLLHQITENVNDTFEIVAKELGVTDGQTEPLEESALDAAVHSLADAMMTIIQHWPKKENALTSTNEREEKYMNNVKVIETAGEYTLLERYDDDNNFVEYVVAEKYDESEKIWSQGHYFTPYVKADNPGYHLVKLQFFTRAMDYLMYKAGAEDDYKGALIDKLNRQTIPYDRMSELATKFKDMLIEETDDDRASERIEELDLTEHELEFFGLEDKYDEYEVEVKQTFIRKYKIAVKKGDSEDNAIQEAEELFDNINMEYDSEIEYYTPDYSARFVGTYNYNDVDVENDIDSL